MANTWHCSATHLQWELDAVQTVLGAIGGGVAAPPVEGDAPDLEPGWQASAADVEVSVHVQRHWGAERTEDKEEEEAEGGDGEGEGGGGGSEGKGRRRMRTLEELKHQFDEQSCCVSAEGAVDTLRETR